MTARARILARIRRSAADVEAPAPLAPAQAAPADNVAQFVAQAEKVHATTSRIASLDDLPEALAGELRQRNLPAAIRTGADPAFDRDWGTVERTTGPGRIAEPATLTRAEFGMAETGSLVFASGPDNPVTLNFLGETHFAVVQARDIQAGSRMSVRLARPRPDPAHHQFRHRPLAVGGYRADPATRCPRPGGAPHLHRG